MNAIEHLPPILALSRQMNGAVLIDVREEAECAHGMAQGALNVPLAQLLEAPHAHLDLQTPAILICAKGMRSANAVQALQAQGYERLASVEGGTDRWRAEGLPMSAPLADVDFLERYSRQMRLPGVGVAGQKKLEASRVLVVGAGGLGSPAAFYLAAAGVGHLRLVDDDVVDRSNLQRQILHTDAGIGTAKVDSARATLTALNPRTKVETFNERLHSRNVEALIRDCDVVFDGSDNFATRYLLNDACVKLEKPLVYGAVQRFAGQVGVFDAGRHRGQCPCYRCLFPEPPSPQDAPNCAEAGVLGVLPGIVGILQTTETLKLLLGIGESLAGRLLSYDALAGTFHETRLLPDPACPLCAPGKRFPGYIDYARFCAGT